jgi:membrane-bound serine protease (ClpP class)
MVKWRASIALVSILAGLILTPATALAQDDSGRDFVDVVEVNGLIDPVLADFIEGSLDHAVEDGASAVVLQMESEGAALDDDRLDDLVTAIEGYELPISTWLGQANNGAAFDGAGRVARATDRIGISPGSELELESGERIGYDELILSEPGSFPFEVQNAPTVLNHLLELPEFDFAVYEIGDTLPNGAVVEGAPTRWPLTDTRFVTLPLIDQQFHTFASPAVAYLLFVIGLGLLVFELFTAGIGVAGVIGAGSLLAGGYGLAVLDARPFAVAFLVIAFIGFAIDVQSGIQQFWSAVGVVGLLVGSVYLLDDYSIGWLPLLVGIVGVLMAMLGGMPAMVRTRFSTPTIGREWMIGSVGSVVEAVDPDGVVSIDGAPWRARTNRATPISVGEEARVVEVDGLLLEVAPLEGAAIDYRERRRSES